MKQKDVAEAFDISSQAVSQWESGRTRPDSRRLANLARLFDVRLEWLLEESGPMAIEAASTAAETPHTTPVPIIDLAQASDRIKVEDPFASGTASSLLQTDLQVSSNAFAMVIESRGMEPDFQPRDKVIIDPKVEPRPGDFVIAKRDGDQAATFKKYRVRNQDDQGCDVIELTPLNADWPTLMIDRENPGHIVGTMVEHRRYRRG